ncbi:MAG: SpoVR family protein, partial [Calditrichaeota bacterium]|nr:SpoVR family protein [Calditrichota bacterium]
GRLNPYRIGVLLFQDIEKRWNTGRFGEEYDNCDNYKVKRNWDKKLGLGREKIFEVRKLYNDVTFIDRFLTEEFCREHRLFSFAYNKSNKRYEIESREFGMIKQRLLQNLTCMGQPIIRVVDANHDNRGELLMEHQFEGTELDKNYCVDTLKNLHSIWNRPVHIRTFLEEKQVLLGFNGQEFKQKWTSEN